MLSRFNMAQQMLILAGAWVAVVQVYCYPQVEVRGTPLVLQDPPGVPRYPRVVYSGRRPPGLPEADYHPNLVGNYPDTPLLTFDLFITALATAAACLVVEVIRPRRRRNRPVSSPDHPIAP
jgi:hypothetical protein